MTPRNNLGRINAQCTVDPLISGRMYRVNVTGETARASYVIHERSEDFAAREGLRKFVDEMTGLNLRAELACKVIS